MQPTTAVRPQKPRVSGQAILTVAAATVLFGVLIGALAWALKSPTFISRIEVVNETPYSVNIDVSGDRGRIGLGTASAGERLDLTDVLDQGDTWVFEFTYAAVDAGELTVERSQLEANDWTIEVPPDVADRLQREGFAPSAE